MSVAANQESKKSVIDYLNALVWDGTPRLDRWIVDCAGAEDTSYVRAVSRAMLVAAVRRVRSPGCQFDQLPVLMGPQGSGKSTALRVLAVEDTWLSDVLPLGDADMRRIIEATEGKWIVEASELESLFRGPVSQEGADDKDDDDDEDDEEDNEEGNDADAEDEEDDEDDDDEIPPAAALKACLSRTHDEARLAYQHERMRVARQFVIVGTTSEADYLRDSMGNRRFWPVRIQRFDLDQLRAKRDQLWAEAAVAEAAGESIRLVNEVQE